MGFVFRLVLALLAALAIGASSAWFALDTVPQSDFIANGAWRVVPSLSDAKLSLYERAALAKASLLLPDYREALYLTATQDETGAPLSGNCTYRIEGANLPARRWSISAYGPKRFLIANPQNRYALSGRDVAGPDGSFVLRVSSGDQAKAWLPLDNARSFSLTLRLYRPDPRIIAAPSDFNAPRLIKESCR